MKDKKYCRECGSQLISTKVFANEVKVTACSFVDVYTMELDSRFDEETGKPNIAEQLTCPKWKKHWLTGENNHDKLTKYKGEYHY